MWRSGMFTKAIKRQFKTTALNCETNVKSTIDKPTNIQRLKGTKTIYNPTSSSSNYKGYLKKKVQPGIYFDPPSSSPTGSINVETIPLSFVPVNDPRRSLLQQIHASNKLNKASDAPPVLAGASSLNLEKTYHLKPEQVLEIQKLRKQDPNKYTRKTLAKMYNVSPLFISLISNVSKDRKSEMDHRLEIIKSNFHPKRTIARADRVKRKQLWYRA